MSTKKDLIRQIIEHDDVYFTHDVVREAARYGISKNLVVSYVDAYFADRFVTLGDVRVKKELALRMVDEMAAFLARWLKKSSRINLRQFFGELCGDKVERLYIREAKIAAALIKPFAVARYRRVTVGFILRTDIVALDMEPETLRRVLCRRYKNL